MQMIKAHGIAIAVLDANLNVLSSNIHHQAFVGRPKEGIVDHNCMEWVHPADIEVTRRRLNRVVTTDEPQIWRRHVVRPDGTIGSGEVTVFAVQAFNQRLLFCSNRVLPMLPVRPNSILKAALEMADYIADMSRSLADLAGKAGLPEIACILDEARAKTAAALELLDPDERIIDG